MYSFVFYIYIHWWVLLIRSLRSTPNLFIQNIPSVTNSLFHRYQFRILTKDVHALYDYINEIPVLLDDIQLHKANKYTICNVVTPCDAMSELCELALEQTDLRDVRFHINNELIE